MLHSQVTQGARQHLTEKIIARKLEKNLSWAAIAEPTGSHVAFVTAACLGQQSLPKRQAEAVAKLLDLDDADVRLLQTAPMRGSIPGTIPTDPTIYRFFEIVQVYGTTLKALLHENFGDGIVSAINFKIDMKKVEDPEGGHRAVITLDGKYLPLKPF